MTPTSVVRYCEPPLHINITRRNRSMMAEPSYRIGEANASVSTTRTVRATRRRASAGGRADPSPTVLPVVTHRSHVSIGHWLWEHGPRGRTRTSCVQPLVLYLGRRKPSFGHSKRLNGSPCLRRNDPPLRHRTPMTGPQKNVRSGIEEFACC